MLRYKIRFILILLLIGLALTMLFYIASDRALVRNFDEHDLAMARQNMHRVASIFRDHLEDLSRTVPDWAFWDDTYEFASSPSPGYVESNLAQAAFLNIHVDAFIVLDLAGRPLYSRAYDHETGRVVPVPHDLLEGFSTWEGFRRLGAEAEVRKGLFVLPEGTVAFAAAPILDSAMRGPSRGILVMTRNVTQEFLDGVGRVAQVDLSILDGGGVKQALAWPSGTDAPEADAAVMVRARDENIIEGYSRIPDARGGKAVTLVALLPRPMKTMGTPITARLAFALLVTMLGVACLTVVLVDRRLLSRLALLNRQVLEVKQNGQLSRRLDVAGGDEISGLSEKINQMLAALQDAQGEVRAREEQLQEALRQKELLLKELHHRIKNNLHAVSSLFGARMPLVKDRAAVEALRQSQHFVQSMALIHQQLYEAREGAGIDFGRYLETLGRILVGGYGRAKEVALEVDCDKVVLNPDTALPMGLVANELITNCLKHAFPGGAAGRVHIVLKGHEGAFYRLEVSDNGVGLPSRGEDTPYSSFGLLMVEGVIDQLGGTMRVKTGEKGVSTAVTFRSYTECPPYGL